MRLKQEQPCNLPKGFHKVWTVVRDDDACLVQDLVLHKYCVQRCRDDVVGVATWEPLAHERCWSSFQRLFIYEVNRHTQKASMENDEETENK